MVCLIIQLICKIIYIFFGFSYKFDTVLYQFLETETSNRCPVCILWFHSVPLFIFPLQSLQGSCTAQASSNDDEMINVRVKCISMFSISPIKEIQHCRRKHLLIKVFVSYIQKQITQLIIEKRCSLHSFYLAYTGCSNKH